MSVDSESPEDINAVIREQRRRSTISSINTNTLYPDGTMLPNSVVRNQEFSTERKTIASIPAVDKENLQESPRRGSYWDPSLVESIRNILQPPEEQFSLDDLTTSNKELFRQNKIKVEFIEQDRTYSPSELSEQEKRRLKRAQRRTLAIPVITELRRATQESLRIAMEISEKMEFTDQIRQDVCVDKRHRNHSKAYKPYDNIHKIKKTDIEDGEPMNSKQIITNKRSLVKINVLRHDEKYLSSRDGAAYVEDS